MMTDNFSKNGLLYMIILFIIMTLTLPVDFGLKELINLILLILFSFLLIVSAEMDYKNRCE